MSSSPESAHLEAIRYVVRAINSAWLGQRYSDIGTFLADDAVVAPLPLEARIRGREAYVQSYRDYDRQATTTSFTPAEPQIDVMGDVAVAVTPFEIRYELDGARYHEKGREILVLSLSAGDWRVIWRTLQSEPVSEPGVEETGG